MNLRYDSNKSKYIFKSNALEMLEKPLPVIDIDDPMDQTGELLGEKDYEALLEEARTEKVQHLVEKHIARRRRELAAALTGS